MSDDYILQMKNIVREYENGGEVARVLKGIDLEVKKGEFLAILGPSGSGKSTLMNIIGCLDTPTSGEYILDGVHVENMNEVQLSKVRNEEIGFIFQSYFMMSRQTARENVEMALCYSDKIREKEQKSRALECLEMVGMKERADFYPKQLSGGQQQRVAIARAISNHPNILLADEPTGALDQKTGAAVVELFHKLNEEGMTIIMITHDAKIASHAGRIVRILDGEIGEGDLSDA